jgi:hypothetical protein
MSTRPERLCFRRSRFGKPEVLGGPSFSLSRSGRWLLLGVSSRGNLGVDVERVRFVPDIDLLMRFSFNSDEVSSVLQVPSGDQLSAFFGAWTRKEALVKAAGTGLWIPMRSFSVVSGGSWCAVPPILRGQLCPTPEDHRTMKGARWDGGRLWWTESVEAPTNNRVRAAVAWDGGQPRIAREIWPGVDVTIDEDVAPFG